MYLSHPNILLRTGLRKDLSKPFKQAMESSASDPERSLQQRLQNFLLTYRSTFHATTGSSPCKLFLNREVRTRLTLIKHDLARRVLNQQGNMKQHHDKHAKPREMEIGDNVLAHDHLTSRKWQPGVILKRTAPHSYRVQLGDGQVWRRHVDDVLQNSLSSSTTNQSPEPSETAGSTTQPTSPPDPAATVTADPEPLPPNTPEPCVTHERTQVRKSGRAVKPPQRLTEQV